MKKGESKRNVKVNVFGGGKIIGYWTNIGVVNIRFANDYVLEEGLDLVSHDVGGPWPRKIIFDPKTGKAQFTKLRELHTDKLEEREVKYLHEIGQHDAKTDIVLF